MSDSYYVYVLKYPDGTPFYVGKGKEDRWNDHEKEAKCSNKELKNLINPLKLNIIRKIWSNEQDVIKEKVLVNVSEKKAFTYEKKLISKYKIRRNGGLLVNLTYGGEGASGYKYNEEQLIEASKRTKIVWDRKYYEYAYFEAYEDQLEGITTELEKMIPLAKYYAKTYAEAQPQKVGREYADTIVIGYMVAKGGSYSGDLMKDIRFLADKVYREVYEEAYAEKILKIKSDILDSKSMDLIGTACIHWEKQKEKIKEKSMLFLKSKTIERKEDELRSLLNIKDQCIRLCLSSQLGIKYEIPNFHFYTPLSWSEDELFKNKCRNEARERLIDLAKMKAIFFTEANNAKERSECIIVETEKAELEARKNIESEIDTISRTGIIPNINDIKKKYNRDKKKENILPLAFAWKKQSKRIYGADREQNEVEAYVKAYKNIMEKINSSNLKTDIEKKIIAEGYSEATSLIAKKSRKNTSTVKDAEIATDKIYKDLDVEVAFSYLLNKLICYENRDSLEAKNIAEKIMQYAISSNLFSKEEAEVISNEKAMYYFTNDQKNGKYGKAIAEYWRRYNLSSSDRNVSWIRETYKDILRCFLNT